ncbi:hypothetical protein EK21DRAFT_116640 [Setomelanomma holmii]|uniref:Uncharacterized protein n=1 Tax=Setomelanomma holmii TaxID=210430 RepID=A0A9P4GZP4_9PLEO|nr:hypothetical protein EK21DRAFT_116640 [Setomelanomma holmii]
MDFLEQKAGFYAQIPSLYFIKRSALWVDMSFLRASVNLARILEGMKGLRKQRMEDTTDFETKTPDIAEILIRRRSLTPTAHRTPIDELKLQSKNVDLDRMVTSLALQRPEAFIERFSVIHLWPMCKVLKHSIVLESRPDEEQGSQIGQNKQQAQTKAIVQNRSPRASGSVDDRHGQSLTGSHDQSPAFGSDSRMQHHNILHTERFVEDQRHGQSEQGHRTQSFSIRQHLPSNSPLATPMQSRIGDQQDSNGVRNILPSQSFGRHQEADDPQLSNPTAHLRRSFESTHSGNSMDTDQSNSNRDGTIEDSDVNMEDVEEADEQTRTDDTFQDVKLQGLPRGICEEKLRDALRKEARFLKQIEHLKRQLQEQTGLRFEMKQKWDHSVGALTLF